jgi:hypothetical protein
MKKKFIVILLLLCLVCGCGKKKKIECTLKNDKDENMRSYIRVTLVANKEMVETEELYAVYKFKSKEEASKNYDKIEKIIAQDDSVKLEQNEENIIAKGKKDVTNMQYDTNAKVSYYEQLGYTCEK